MVEAKKKFISALTPEQAQSAGFQLTPEQIERFRERYPLSPELVRHFAKGKLTPGPTVPTKAARGTVKSKVFAAVKEMREKGEIPPEHPQKTFRPITCEENRGLPRLYSQEACRLGSLADPDLKAWHPLAP